MSTRPAEIVRWMMSLFATAVVVVALPACGGADSAREFDPNTETFETFLNSVTYEYDAASSVEELAERSGVVAKATLIDVEDGRIFGESQDDPFASRTLNLVFGAVDGSTYYVEVPRPADSSVDRLREVFPIGGASIIFLQPNNDPPENWFNAREDGNQWFFTTPQGWIVEMAEGKVTVPFVPAGDIGFAIPSGGDADLEAWIPNDDAAVGD